MAEKCEEVYIPQVDIDQFDALFDTLNTKVRGQLQADYDCKKINGATFAATWAAMMSPAVGQILSSIVSLQNKETAADRCVKQAQCDKIQYEIDNLLPIDKDIKTKTKEKISYEVSTVLPAQVSLTNRQRTGFDDNVNQKLFEAQINSWAMMFSSGLLEETPSIISNDSVSALYGRLVK